MLAETIQTRLAEYRDRQAQARRELESMQNKQQALVQEILTLQGAIQALEALVAPQTLVTALPAQIPPGN